MKKMLIFSILFTMVISTSLSAGIEEFNILEIGVMKGEGAIKGQYYIMLDRNFSNSGDLAPSVCNKVHWEISDDDATAKAFYATALTAYNSGKPVRICYDVTNTISWPTSTTQLATLVYITIKNQ